jgi:hypothetical protein
MYRPGHIALALWESILGGRRPDGNFFEHFSSLIQAISRLESEPKKRYHALLQILTKTMEEIDEKVDENDFAGRKNDKDADRRLELFASTFISHFCEFIRKQGLTINLKIYPCSKALDFAYRYSLGGYFPKQLFKNLDWSTIFKELLKDIRYYEEKSEEKTAWQYSVLGLAFRIAAHSGREKSIPEISRWVDHCRVFSLRDRNENEISKMVVRSLETGFRCSKGEESNLDRLVMILSELGGHVLANELEYLMIYRSHLDFTFPRDMLENVMEKLKVISRYGPLNSDDCRFVITKNLVPCTKMVLMKETPPDSLLEFIQWLEVQGEQWFRLSLYHQQTWARLFRLPNRLLVKCLAQWATRKVAESGLSWEQMSALMSSLLQFCVNESDLEDDPYEPDDYPDDTERQRFIRDNIWIMNAVIDSVHIRFPCGHSDTSENDFGYA